MLTYPILGTVSSLTIWSSVFWCAASWKRASTCSRTRCMKAATAARCASTSAIFFTFSSPFFLRSYSWNYTTHKYSSSIVPRTTEECRQLPRYGQYIFNACMSLSCYFQVICIPVIVKLRQAKYANTCFVGMSAQLGWRNNSLLKKCTCTHIVCYHVIEW